MAQALHKLDTRRQHPATQAAQAAAEAGFKPIAIPALAAAVETARRAAPRAAAPKDVPAILRNDATYS